MEWKMWEQKSWGHRQVVLQQICRLQRIQAIGSIFQPRQFWFAWIQYLMLCVGLSAISWPGLGPVTKHKNQYRLWTLGPWLLTPTSLRSHHLKASCQQTHPSLMASVCWYPPMMTHSGMTRVMTHSEMTHLRMTRVMAASPTQHRCDSSWSGSEDRHKQISRGQTGK